MNKNTIKYSSNILSKHIKSLKQKYQFLDIGVIGKSVLNKPLWYIKIGKGREEVFYSASFHASEWITTLLLMKFVEDYADAIANDKKIYNRSAKDLYHNKTLYIVPMVNPDGVNFIFIGFFVVKLHLFQQLFNFYFFIYIFT